MNKLMAISGVLLLAGLLSAESMGDPALYRVADAQACNGYMTWYLLCDALDYGTLSPPQLQQIAYYTGENCEGWTDSLFFFDIIDSKQSLYYYYTTSNWAAFIPKNKEVSSEISSARSLYLSIARPYALAGNKGEVAEDYYSAMSEYLCCMEITCGDKR